MDALALQRFQFAFTISFHYLFPQITMGLGLLIVIMKSLALRGHPLAGDAARFWTRIFGVAFVLGVVTGIPMEFQFGTGWSRFSEATGSIIGQTLAMEGVFAFVLESAFLWALLFGERRLGPRAHFAAAVLVWLGSWLSAYFIVCTNAFMQHPVGHEVLADGSVRLVSLGAYLTNPWALVQYAHTMVGSVITASFVVAGTGAFYVLAERRDVEPHARFFLRTGVIAALVSSLAAAFPTGDLQAKAVVAHQPVAFAAMEGLFESERGPGIALVGQPDMERLRLDNPLIVPELLSFLTYQRFGAEFRGLDAFPRDEWPDNVPLLYYAYHVMAGLGTIFIALAALAALLLRGGRLYTSRLACWLLVLATPLPFVANTAGWMTAELGRQPWLVYGLLRTADGVSPNISAGTALFTLIGFMGLYALVALAALAVFRKIVLAGPGDAHGAH